MAVTDISDIRKRRRSKKFQRFLNKMIIILAAVLAVLIIYVTKDKWYPYLDGILTKIPVPESTGELAEGYFPISITGGASYQLKSMEGHFAVIDDSHFNIYNIDGKPAIARQHTYANPILTASSKRALIYDLGGKQFCLYSKYDKVYDKTTENAILLAKLSSDDQVAVVTKSDKYLSCLDVYDPKGKNIFVYKSYDSRIIDVTFNAENTGCIITTIGASGGQLVSQMHYYQFTKTDMVWQSDLVKTMVLSSRLYKENQIAVFGDTECSFYDTNGIFIGKYEYEYSLVDFDSSSTLSAILFNNQELRSSVLVIIDDILNEPVEIELDDEAENVCVYGDTVYIMTSGMLYSYSPTGEIVSSVSLSNDYDNFCKSEDYVFLLGYDEINRIDFN